MGDYPKRPYSPQLHPTSVPARPVSHLQHAQPCRRAHGLQCRHRRSPLACKRAVTQPQQPNDPSAAERQSQRAPSAHQLRSSVGQHARQAAGAPAEYIEGSPCSRSARSYGALPLCGRPAAAAAALRCSLGPKPPLLQAAVAMSLYGSGAHAMAGRYKSQVRKE